jgi:hypothetical protein
MEKFFSKADYIFGPSAYSNGQIIASVPAGTYYIRVLQRKVITGVTKPYGPPETGDLTSGTTLDLGMKFALPFASAPITITGTVKNHSGTPLAGRYVRATTEPCYEGGYDWGPNYCGPVKFLALRPTDANGAYTLELRDPGTYYLSIFSSWDTSPGCSGYCAAQIIGTGINPQPVTVQTGEHKTVDIVPF